MIYYYELKNCTDLDCVLVTSETQETVPKDLSVWKDKCIFYSPRIETGVDFSIDTSQSVFFHIGASDLWLPNDLQNPEHEGPDVVRKGEEGQALPLPEPK